MPLDTLKAAKRLQEDDLFSPEQAERMVFFGSLAARSQSQVAPATVATNTEA